MLMPFMRERLLVSLAGTPDVLDELVRRLMPHDPVWTLRPDQNRYTMREVMAHLLALETKWFGRIAQTSARDGVTLPMIDLAQLEVDFQYSSCDPLQCRTKFREHREVLVKLLTDLEEDHWQHFAYWTRAGAAQPARVTIDEQASLIAMHDGYHTAQVAQWLAIGRQQ